MKPHDSDPKEPDAEPQKLLSEMEKRVIKALKETQRTNSSPSTIEDLDSILEALTKFNTKVKAFRIKDVGEDEKRNGLLDSGSSHNVREVKVDSNRSGNGV